MGKLNFNCGNDPRENLDRGSKRTRNMKIRNTLRDLYYDIFLNFFISLHHLFYYGRWDFFDTILLETTTYCNFRCWFCPNSIYPRGLLKNKKLMPTEVYKKVINELAAMHYYGTIYPFIDGEPLGDKRMPELVRYTREKLPKAKIMINTNGSFLTIPLYEKLLKCGVTRIDISQYAKEMLPNVRKVLDYAKKARKNKSKISYRIFDKGGYLIQNRGGEIKKAKSYEKPRCTYPDNNVVIDYNGDVRICCDDYHSSVKFGNVKNEKVIDIYNKPFYRKIRKELKRRIYRFPVCKKCMGVG